MRVVAKAEALIQDDPRPADKATWHRLKLMVEHEACHPAWGCALYRLERTGRITRDEKMAGDQYWRVCEDYKRIQATDPEDEPEQGRDLAYRRINRAKRKYDEIKGFLGFGRRVLDPLIFEERWPESEKEHLIVKQCLVLLKNFFSTGTKRVRKSA